MDNYCEDYPCCGHTDGLGCNWTYATEAREYDMTHVMCDHEAGFCDAYDEGEDECPGDPDECPYGGCGDCDEDDYEGGEDSWLDGSYEE